MSLEDWRKTFLPVAITGRRTAADGGGLTGLTGNVSESSMRWSGSLFACLLSGCEALTLACQSPLHVLNIRVSCLSSWSLRTIAVQMNGEQRIREMNGLPSGLNETESRSRTNRMSTGSRAAGEVNLFSTSLLPFSSSLLLFLRAAAAAVKPYLWQSERGGGHSRYRPLVPAPCGALKISLWPSESREKAKW